MFLGKKVLFYKICLLGTDGNIEQFRIVVYIVHISQGTRMVQDFSTLNHNKWLYIAIFHKFNFLYPYSSGPRGHGFESRHSDQKSSDTSGVGGFFFWIMLIRTYGLFQFRTDCEGPGIESDCCRWQMKGGRNGAAVKIGSEVTSVSRFWAPQEVAMGSNPVTPTKNPNSTICWV